MRRVSALYLVVVFGVLAIIAYNTWSVCGGRCSRTDFLTMNLPLVFLIGANLVAFTTLLVLQRKRKRFHQKSACGCGGRIDDHWTFCGHCGRRLNSDA